MLLTSKRLSIPIILILVSVFVCLSSYAKKDEGEGQDYLDLKKEKVEKLSVSRGGKGNSYRYFNGPELTLKGKGEEIISAKEAQRIQREKETYQRVKKLLPPLKNPRHDRWPILIFSYFTQTEPMADIFIKGGLSPFFPISSFWQIKRYLPIMNFFQNRGSPIFIRPHGWLHAAFIKSPSGTHCQHLPPAKAGTEYWPSMEGAGHCPAWMYENPALYSHATNAQAVCRNLKENGVIPKFILLDFESGVYLRSSDEKEENVRLFMNEALKCPRCLRKFGKENLNTLEKFRDVADKARSYAFRTGATEPVRKVFPDPEKVRIGDYFIHPIRREGKVEGRYPAYGYEGSGLNVAMPRCYMVPGFGGAGKNQDKVNWNIFYYCVEHFSSCARVLKEDEMMVPFVGYILLRKMFIEKIQNGFKIASSGAYREMVIHTLMRGAETIAVYEGGMTAGDKFSEEVPADFDRRELGPWLLNVLDLQQAYDEMLAYNDILRQGRVLNYDIKGAYNQLDETTAVWSGVATDKKALIRTVTFGPELVKAIKVFNKAIKLPFNKKGQFFWVYSDGKVEPIN